MSRVWMVVLGWISLSFPVVAGDHRETPDFRAVHSHVLDLIKQYGPQKVLVVLDIDNTLLALNQDLGSDQWFNWQENLLKQSPKSPHLVAPDFNGLLKVQRILHTLSQMHPPEPLLPELITDLKKKGCTFVLLTSRGPEIRDATQRELSRNGYDFTKVSLKIHEPVRGRFLPYTFDRRKKPLLPPELLKRLTAGKPRLVSYAEGIFMTSGQHKGLMLRSLLARTDRHFEAICFVDDHEKHSKRMRAAFKGSKIDLSTFRYSREDGNVAAFHRSNKHHVVQGWRKLKSILTETFIEE